MEAKPYICSTTDQLCRWILPFRIIIQFGKSISILRYAFINDVQESAIKIQQQIRIEENKLEKRSISQVKYRWAQLKSWYIDSTFELSVSKRIWMKWKLNSTCFIREGNWVLFNWSGGSVCIKYRKIMTRDKQGLELLDKLYHQLESLKSKSNFNRSLFFLSSFLCCFLMMN